MPHLDQPGLTFRDQLLIAGVRTYYQACGHAAAIWAGEQAGLSDAMVEMAMDDAQKFAFRSLPAGNDQEAWFLVFAPLGMPTSRGGTH